MAKKDESYYWITPEGGGKDERFTRATTFAATLDNRYALEKWGERRAAVGLARRPDLLAQVAAYEEDAHRLDSIITRAQEAGEATKGRDIGDALHKLTERVDKGELEVGAIGEHWRPDVEAYRRAMEAHAFDVEMIETTVVIPQLGVAGTFDRLVTQGGSECRIFDLKFGQSDLGVASWAIQLALYAHGSFIYDLDTDERRPMPEVNQSIGYVAHIPAGSGECEMITLDLEAGWQGALLAHQVRGWRTPRSKFVLPTVVGPLERRLWLSAELRRLVEHFPDAADALAQQLAALSILSPRQARERGIELTDMDIDSICNAVHSVEGEWQVPFGEAPDPAHRDRLTKSSTN